MNTLIENPTRSDKIADRITEACDDTFYQLIKPLFIRNHGSVYNNIEERALQEMKATALSVIDTIRYDKGTGTNPKRYLAECSIRSLKEAIKDAVIINLPIDNRKFAYLSIYEENGEKVCKYGVQYQGILQKLLQVYPDADVKSGIVFKGDEFLWEEDGEKLEWSFKPSDSNMWRSDYMNALGSFCVITYTYKGEKRMAYERIGIKDIEQIRKCAKTKYVWDNFAGEKIRIATARRACKWILNKSNVLTTLDEIDNYHYNMNQAGVVSQGDSGDFILTREEAGSKEKGASQFADNSKVTIDITGEEVLENDSKEEKWDGESIYYTTGVKKFKFKSVQEAGEKLYNVIRPAKRSNRPIFLEKNELLLTALFEAGEEKQLQRIYAMVGDSNNGK